MKINPVFIVAIFGVLAVIFIIASAGTLTGNIVKDAQLKEAKSEAQIAIEKDPAPEKSAVGEFIALLFKLSKEAEAQDNANIESPNQDIAGQDSAEYSIEDLKNKYDQLEQSFYDMESRINDLESRELSCTTVTDLKSGTCLNACDALGKQCVASIQKRYYVDDSVFASIRTDVFMVNVESTCTQNYYMSFPETYDRRDCICCS